MRAILHDSHFSRQSVFVHVVNVELFDRDFLLRFLIDGHKHRAEATVENGVNEFPYLVMLCLCLPFTNLVLQFEKFTRIVSVVNQIPYKCLPLVHESEQVLPFKEGQAFCIWKLTKFQSVLAARRQRFRILFAIAVARVER